MTLSKFLTPGFKTQLVAFHCFSLLTTASLVFGLVFLITNEPPSNWVTALVFLPLFLLSLIEAVDAAHKQGIDDSGYGSDM